MEENLNLHFSDYISPDILKHLDSQSTAVDGIEHLRVVGTPQKSTDPIETTEALAFACDLFDSIANKLTDVLEQRKKDRLFIDQHTRQFGNINLIMGWDPKSSYYKSVIGLKNGNGTIPFGPLKDDYFKASGKSIASLPAYLTGPHITLFGPPDSPKMAVNAMNAFHRRLDNEPPFMSELIYNSNLAPKWGADDEDSKTPLRDDLKKAALYLKESFAKSISYQENKNSKKYILEDNKLSHPIKRIPGIAIPSTNWLYKGSPLPLHIISFAMHAYHLHHQPEAMVFYIPKLENEHEAAYIKAMVQKAEELIRYKNPNYRIGTIRLLIVLENPRAVFRINEIMDQLHPYFAGASLGWHDFLASTARLFKEDSQYRIPVKADPNIVIKHIHASHRLLSEVVGKRNGIKIGGMYGVLPSNKDLQSHDFQIVLMGYIKDVYTQLKRGLDGFWVAHPDFIRIGIALYEAFAQDGMQPGAKVKALISALIIDPKNQDQVLTFLMQKDDSPLAPDHPNYPRSLLAANVGDSNIIQNNDSEEIRYNVFQSLQYLVDWLMGHGCVALPASMDKTFVRIMDDLATCERSRWEIWHEIYHGRFALADFLKIVLEEMNFIKKDHSNEDKRVQIKWDQTSDKWYPVAMKILLKLSTDQKPVEFATELLLPFTIDCIRNSASPWEAARALDKNKFSLSHYIEKFLKYFECFGSKNFADSFARKLIFNESEIREYFQSISLDEIIQAAEFHGDIGEDKKNLDHNASVEQQKVQQESKSVRTNLYLQGLNYRKKFSFKFLISAQGKSASDIKNILEDRMQNTYEQEIDNAKQALLDITLMRANKAFRSNLMDQIDGIRKKHSVIGLSLAVGNSNSVQTLAFGKVDKFNATKTEPTSFFQMASLSKTIASVFALEFFKQHSISLQDSVNKILEEFGSSFRVGNQQGIEDDNAKKIKLQHLLNHTALGLHYVSGFNDHKLPSPEEILSGRYLEDGYKQLFIDKEPGKAFAYSGGGFLLLEYLINLISGQTAAVLIDDFLQGLGVEGLTFNSSVPKAKLTKGYKNQNEVDFLRFPSFAAGSVGTPKAMACFLQKLIDAYQNLRSPNLISHDTAITVLHGLDKGSRGFMGADMGLGVFIKEAGSNTFMVHQGANDGFRSIFLACFKGPDAGKKIVINCNGDKEAVDLICKLTTFLLRELKIEGIESITATKKTIEVSKQEEHVNQQFKEQIFSLFQENLPEDLASGPQDLLGRHSILTDWVIQSVSDQSFARAGNALKTTTPVFDPDAFGPSGKLMDSWESARHNEHPYDELHIVCKNPINPAYAVISTEFHLGNQAEAAALLAQKPNGSWVELFSQSMLSGHALHYFTLDADLFQSGFKEFKLRIFPDGGLSRLWLFDKNLPPEQKQKFPARGKPVQKVACPSKIEKPKAAHDLNLRRFDLKEIQNNMKRLKKDQVFNLSSSVYGASIVKVSNEHYGPAHAILSPFDPIGMFDGFESKRSRGKDHYEEIVIEFAKRSQIHWLELDFTYFVNNAPQYIEVEALVDRRWKNLIPKCYVKKYRGNKAMYSVEGQKIASRQIRIKLVPDGGINRVKAYGCLAEENS